MLDQLWYKEGILCTSYWYLKVRRKGNIWRGKKKLVLHLLSLFFIIYNCVYTKIRFVWLCTLLIYVVNILFLLLNMGLICWDHHIAQPSVALCRHSSSIASRHTCDSSVCGRPNQQWPSIPLYVLIQYIPVSTVGKLVSLPIRASFSKSVISW